MAHRFSVWHTQKAIIQHTAGNTIQCVQCSVFHILFVYIIKCLDMCSSNFLSIALVEEFGAIQQESFIGIWIFIRVRKKFINKAAAPAAPRPEWNMCNQNIRVYCTLYTFRTLQLQMHSLGGQPHTPIQAHTFTHLHTQTLLIFILSASTKNAAYGIKPTNTNVRFIHSFHSISSFILAFIHTFTPSFI